MTPQLRDVRSSAWPADGTTEPAVALLLHGYGSNEHDLTGLIPAFGLALPWASLRAPLELGTGGAAWFPITTPGNPDARPVAEATETIWAWVDANLAPGTRVIPIGFSQGGLMASQLLRTRPERVLAPVVLGGFVLAAEQPGDATLAETRPAVFWGRGAEDRVIGEAAITRTSAYLPQHSTLVERVYPGLAHGIDATEAGDVRDFLALQAARKPAPTKSAPR
ncbi:phospholipase/carboxylesterase [Cryobacterium sp. MP_3.1]|uniref:alpha/beta hydrolase n=1 Tax=Cryobacterium sp. MP_3.1 TaxID=3071711 RepID=UPI002DF86B18|nr:phospholipase/carboxylesterase [Cryobacterium sp. MP_3.1]